MLQLKHHYSDRDGIIQDNNTTQYYNDGENIVIKILNKFGIPHEELVPLGHISDFQPYIEGSQNNTSIFDRLNRDFNMQPEEVRNPFIISSRFPEPIAVSSHLLMPYETPQESLPSSPPPKAVQNKKMRRTIRHRHPGNKTPHKKNKSPERKVKLKQTRRNDRPYGNKIKQIKSHSK